MKLRGEPGPMSDVRMSELCEDARPRGLRGSAPESLRVLTLKIYPMREETEGERKGERKGRKEGRQGMTGEEKRMLSRFPVTGVSTSGKSVSHRNVGATEPSRALRSRLVCNLALWKCHKEMLCRERVLTGSHFGSFLSKTLSRRESAYCGVICRSRLEGQMRGLERGPGCVMKP